MKVKVIALPVETWDIILKTLNKAEDCGPKGEGWVSPELSAAVGALDFALGKSNEEESLVTDAMIAKESPEPSTAPEPFLESPLSFTVLKSDKPMPFEGGSRLNSTMTPAIESEGLDEALKDVVKTLESPVEWIPIESSNLKAVAYNEEIGLLLVEFKSEKVYKYMGVPKGVFEKLTSPDTESKGRFFAENIKEQFPFERMK